jgi:hypothetical protein
VYIATETGAPISADVVIVQAAIEKWAEPWCVTATAIAAGEVAIDIAYQVWVQSATLTAAAIKSAISTALAVYLDSLPIGGLVISPASGKVYVEQLIVTISGATPGIVRVDVSVPAADVAITADAVAVLGTVTGTVVFL